MKSKQPTIGVLPNVGDVCSITSYRYDTFYGVPEIIRTHAYVSILRRTQDEKTGEWRFRAQLRLGHLTPEKTDKVTLLLADFDEVQYQAPRISIREESAALSADFLQRMRSDHTRHAEVGQLLVFFNVQMVDFVRQQADGRFTACEGPKKATHKLEPTSWNDPRANAKKTRKEMNLVRNAPKNWAISVCAVPLTRKYVLKGPPVHATRALPSPKKRPVYEAHGTLTSKRLVLTWMAKAMHARIHLRYIKSATEEQCAGLYRNLLVAHHHLKNK